jgi:propanol-preferring alcohol dehydrogenase
MSMRAIVVNEWGGPLELVERPELVPSPGDAVMRVRAAGVGLTINHIRNGTFGGTAPRILGHEVAGEITALGSGVTDLAVGDRCAVYGYLNCGHCRWCRNGRETLCQNPKGVVGKEVDGGFADFICLPAENFIRLPDGLAYEAAAVATDAICTTWHCMKERARVQPLDDVLIFGAGGGVGIHAVQMARLFGGRVIAADISDEKLKLAEQWGADAQINVREQDIALEVRRLTDGKGVEAAIDFAGFPETYEAAIASLSTAGRAVIIGVQSGAVSLDPRQLIATEQTLTGSRYCSKQELAETFEVVARGLVTPIVGKRVPLEDIDAIFDDLQNETLLGRGALTF